MAFAGGLSCCLACVCACVSPARASRCCAAASIFNHHDVALECQLLDVIMFKTSKCDI